MPKRLYVGNLDYLVTSNQLRDLFESIGPTTSAHVVSDRESGKSRGFGFVEMQEESDATRAFEELNGHAFIEGRKLLIKEARPREDGDGDSNRRSSSRGR